MRRPAFQTIYRCRIGNVYMRKDRDGELLFRFDMNNMASLKAQDIRRLAGILMRKSYPWRHYYERHRERVLAYSKAYYAKNREQIRARRRARQGAQ